MLVHYDAGFVGAEPDSDDGFAQNLAHLSHDCVGELVDYD
jgi:hypothetical protein